MDYILYFDYAALIIIIVVMVHFFSKKNLRILETEIYSGLLVLTAAATLMDIVDAYTCSYAAFLPLWFVYTIKIGYLIIFDSTAAFYFCYILYSVKSQNQISIWNKLEFALPILFNYILILTTPFTDAVFRFDENGTYSYGPGMYVLYGIALYYVVNSLVVALRHPDKLTFTQRSSVYFYTISSLLAVLLQLVFANLMVACFAVSISMLLIYLSLENVTSYENRMLGTYNREAFLKVIGSWIEERRRFHILGIQIEGMKYVNETVGVENGNLMLKQVAEFFMGLSAKSKIFHISGVRFAIVLEEEKTDIESIIEQIVTRFKEPFEKSDIELFLSVRICKIQYPTDMQRLEEIIDTIDYSLKEAVRTKENDIFFASQEVLKSRKRENQILQLMKNALANDLFEVYYQPIYSVKEECYTSAEALVRLRDEELGYISPEEFIPLAEKNGLIMQIDEFVFDSVCRCIVEQKLKENGIEYIEVNLSAVEGIQKNLPDRLIAVMDRYHLPHHMINLEITETAAVTSNTVLMDNMRALIASDVSFAMDDYGTGFSNITQVMTYPFSIIKFDKSMVWSAMEGKRAMCALKYTTAMMKEMDFCIVAEGVETLEQVNVLKELGCDYFQGYYYSKPIPEEQFVEKIRLQNRSINNQ